jgi:hypothetical protein
MTRVRLIAEDVERLRAAFPKLDDAALGSAMTESARRHAHDDPDPDDALERFVHDAAALATFRHRLLDAVGRRAAARHDERDAYEERIELDVDVLPPLRAEARALRAEIRRLESALRVKGVDPAAVEPTIEGSTVAVDRDAGPRYVDAAERRRAAVAFFRRTGRDR